MGKDFTFPKPLVIEFFFLTYNGVRIFSSIIRHERYLFSGQHFFPPDISLQEFFPLEISLRDIFLSEITHTPPPLPLSKVKWSSPEVKVKAHRSYEVHRTGT